jgi:SpoVK/Ycf46/Vps4 family AAA+-type ATPase
MKPYIPNMTKSKLKPIPKVNLKQLLRVTKSGKRGLNILLSGSSQPGKTKTAALLGRRTRRDVFRVDLAMVISKYIGETEKNLAKLVDLAEARDWILFFDEADALFGKRSEVRDAHDRFARLLKYHQTTVLIALENDRALEEIFHPVINYKYPVSESEPSKED